MINKNLDLVAIDSILGEKFFVPHYQRGYRWTKKEVRALLEDIWQFFLDNQNSPKEAFYCLQPLVVTKKDDEWVLVDGQQRLTTIFLILSSLDEIMTILEKEKYSLRYETRKNSEDFLKKIKIVEEDKKFGNIDFYHIWEAFQAITGWFSENKGAKMPILNTLLNNDVVGKNVKVIWYEIKNKDAIEIFTRINMGKIPLTNSELIKALFLRKNNFNLVNDEHIYLRQLEIASEWDRIENALQKDAFWYFIHDNPTKYDTRIEFIFDLMKNKTASNDEHFTFVEFSKEFDTHNDKSDIWLNVKEYFMRLEEWYNDRTLYHLIGYSITTGSKINEILQKSKNLPKDRFENYLRDKIKDKMKNVELDNISYSDNRNVKNILLLFNIQTILNTPKSNIRFPFDEYKKENWDIEHISSIMSETPSLGKSRKWLQDVREYFTGITVLDHYEKNKTEVNPILREINLLLEREKYQEYEFTALFPKILKYFKEDYRQNEYEKDSFVHSLGNLTLLDATTNRSYKNAVFPVKRKRILKNDKNGLFVPICTKNVFLKYYSEKLDDVMFWQKSDANAYLSAIKKTLKPYF